ncbi:hypothetical protein [Cytobacillus depressus]|nr:hypothetical protein [Cytobacillus depressus]
MAKIEFNDVSENPETVADPLLYPVRSEPDLYIRREGQTNLA